MKKQRVTIFISPKKAKLLRLWALEEMVGISKLVEDNLKPPPDAFDKLLEALQ